MLRNGGGKIRQRSFVKLFAGLSPVGFDIGNRQRHGASVLFNGVFREKRLQSFAEPAFFAAIDSVLSLSACST